MSVLLLVVHATPLPVQVTNLPGPDPLSKPAFRYEVLTFWITAFALGVALYAAYYAKRAFKTAEDDLKISKENLSVAQRKPQLEASFLIEPDISSGSTGGRAFEQHRCPRLIASVRNAASGQRRCDSFYIEVVVPTSSLSVVERSRLLSQGDDAEARVYFEVITDTALFPSGSSTGVSFAIRFNYVTEPQTVEIQYRMKDDYQDYPESGYLTATVQLPMRDKNAYVQFQDAAENRLWQACLTRFVSDPYTPYMMMRDALERMGPMIDGDRVAAADELIRTTVP